MAGSGGTASPGHEAVAPVGLQGADQPTTGLHGSTGKTMLASTLHILEASLKTSGVASIDFLSSDPNGNNLATSKGF